MNNIKVSIIIFLMFLFVTSQAFAQGTLKGVVVDSLTSQPLVGANVFVVGTSLGSATDIEGEYKITRIPAGNFKLKVSYIGYESKEFDLSIQDNRTLEFFIELVVEVLEGNTVVITAQALGQAAAINQQLTSNTIVNVISEEKIQELPDANAAEAIGRLPGVSLSRSGGEANKIILRGLSDRYTSVTLDGIRIPSTDSLGRGIDLSAISQSSLAGIELFKALTSDKDADAIAGSVNLVTKKAPKEREIRTLLKGGYNDVMNSAEQYDFSIKYGERFFDQLLGVQVTGNLENKIRSSETINLAYDQNILNQTSYFINNFTIQYTDEIRKRNGIGIILDFDTPDDGNIKFNNNYYSTKRDFITHTRDYPNGGGNSQYLGGVTYIYRDREEEIKNFNSSLTGNNNLFGLNITWGVSFAQSKTEFPYDYQLDFSEPSNAGTSGMKSTPQFQDHPERFIDYAYNNFRAATLAGAYYSSQNTLDKNRSAYIDFKKDYSIGDLFFGELKAGGKYKLKNRSNISTQSFAPYYLGYWQPYKRLDDGSIVQKDLTGSYFDAFFQRYLENPLNNTLSFLEFLDATPESRKVYDLYDLNPLINRDKLRQWYDLNHNGVSKNGSTKEYYNDPTLAAFTYNISEAVSSGYLMNTIKFGQNLTIITGLRVEQENNDYQNTYSRVVASGFPSITIVTRDTTANYSETIVLPNFHLNFKATDFLNIRLAAYKALSRPDYNMRLNTYFAWRPAAVGGNKQLVVGNPKLKTSKAWNFEINTSFYGNDIGLFSVSAFYKEIDDMYHMLNQINTEGDVLFEALGLETKSLHTGNYQLTIPYNSPHPSKVWGFELEHQIILSFLPGLLKNIVLSYNASIVKSETHLIGARTDTTYSTIPGIPFPIQTYEEHAIEYKQQLEDQPEFFGNISLGYDIGGFSGRVSVFHQSEYNSSFSPSGRSDRIIAGYTRVDLALKQKITDYLSIHLNINNLTNLKDENILNNRVNEYRILRTSSLYGLTADLGVRVDL